VLVVLVVVSALASIAVGTRSMGLGEVWRSLLDTGLTTENAVIIRELRVPRTVLGLLVGLSLGIAGALMQGHTATRSAIPACSESPRAPRWRW
jgi:ABC-type Fe3+-siderophore transport system permease subunit